MDSSIATNERFSSVLDRLIAMSREDDHNPFHDMLWPEQLPENCYWMSPELLSVHGSTLGNELSESQLISLSKWESISFYSLNVHGIRDLLTEVVARIHTPGFELASEYFHHFVEEENEHMWFFAKFCNNYGGKLYANKRVTLGDVVEPDIQHFLVFARINIFEEIVDYFNTRMADDDRLPECIRDINRIHHKDESRHIAFGRQIMRILHHDLKEKYSLQRIAELGDYISRYIRASLQMLYNPLMYIDAGIPEPYRIPLRLLSDPARQSFHSSVLKRSLDFLTAQEIVADTAGCH